ncbi:MAG: hypothetical protein PUF45_08510 [Lachnospiraceae bacterium]|nr:hypothetical protein [Lachnospiraceae bacterium]
MRKIRLALCIGEPEYQTRLTSCMLTYYKSQFELFLFSDPQQLWEGQQEYDVILCGDYPDEICSVAQKRMEPILYLIDTEEQDPPEDLCEGHIRITEKYQEITTLVDEIMSCIGGEVREVCDRGFLSAKTKVTAVYSLAENEYQMPFIATMASILADEQSVLVVDLQENSGLSQLIESPSKYGLEELMVMAESGTYSNKRLQACISHKDKVNYIFSAESTECISEASVSTYTKMMQLLKSEMNYEVILVNLGSRFTGFFEFLYQCNQVILLQRKSGLCQWREYELVEEMKRRGYTALLDRMVPMEVPLMTGIVTSCERLVEQWKWNEFGDRIRGVTPKVAKIG